MVGIQHQRVLTQRIHFQAQCVECLASSGARHIQAAINQADWRVSMNIIQYWPGIGRRIVVSIVSAMLIGLTPSDASWAEARGAGHDGGENPLRVLLLADRVARYGWDNRDPLALIMAARMVQGIQFGDARLLQGKQAPAHFTQGVPPSLDLNELLRRAHYWAGQRQELLTLIDDVKNGGMREVIGNIGLLGGNLAPGKSVVYRFSFEGGGDASVAILPTDPEQAGSMDFDLVVHDGGGRTACKSVDRGMPQPCAWVPAKTGVFSVSLKNRGREDATYTLLVR